MDTSCIFSVYLQYISVYYGRIVHNTFVYLFSGKVCYSIGLWNLKVIKNKLRNLLKSEKILL